MEMNKQPFVWSRRAPTITLYSAANLPMVRAGGRDDLTERQYDAANNVNHRAGVNSPTSTYDTAMMGGEPYSYWA